MKKKTKNTSDKIFFANSYFYLENLIHCFGKNLYIFLYSISHVKVKAYIFLSMNKFCTLQFNNLITHL